MDGVLEHAGPACPDHEVLGAAPAHSLEAYQWHGPSSHERLRVHGKFFARGGRRLRVQGVTYGPFACATAGEPFPLPRRVADDFAAMQAAGINALRTYHVPPEWLLRQADEQRMLVLVDVPWSKHVCYLDSKQARHEARLAVRQAAARGREHQCLLAYSIGNEVPPDIIRWHGARRVERFLAELADVARQTDPGGLVTYASYPPTEYLDLSAFDFVTFNVYLHDREAFRRYLFRLQNLTGDRPLLLGELGMDTLRHGELAQAEFLAGHITQTRLMGLAGAFVFSWTDDWHTGGHPIDDWGFGITHRDRTAKPSYHALREVFEKTTVELLPRTPRVSVVVCTYNGGRTLEQCLRSLAELDYPNYDVIVVDDGSTDDTPSIVARFPKVRGIRQANHGLSMARNAGLHAATGSIIVYTDSDCFADPDWLTHLVHQLEQSGAAAVGGPNLTPEDGRLAACVAAAPGQPTHVLESDQVAEHVPGCNMAFRREALLAINGFDPQYRKAGDDVDVCWRLQQAGMWITFAPGAFVWHHRRQTPRAFLKQQAGYGEAEGLLLFKHPDKFTGRGDGKWRGVLYGESLRGLRLDDAIIYRGTFGTGLFQCIYQPGPAHWAMLPATLEWHMAVAMAALAGLFWWPILAAAGVLLGLSLLIAALQATQVRLPAQHAGLRARCLVAVLCYLQPLARSWARYRTRLLCYRLPGMARDLISGGGETLPLIGRRTVAYWSEQGCERTALLSLVVARLMESRLGVTVDSGWSDWDVEVHCDPWTVVQVGTVQENHGGNKRLIRARYRLRCTGKMKALRNVVLVAIGAGASLLAWPALLAAGIFLGMAAGLAGVWLGLWWRGTRRAAHAVAVLDAAARQLDLVRCTESGGG